jgi:septum formation protein
MPKLILASASPRRLDLLKSINIKPDIIFPANIDESIKKKEKPNFYLKRIPFEKALYAQNKYKDDIILSADTIVTTNQKVFGKPSNEEEAVKTLKFLSGRNHKVQTGVCVLFKNLKKIKIIDTKIKFKKLHQMMKLMNISKLKRWIDKAGAYAIQGFAERFIIKITGSYSNVVGLPLYETANILKGIKNFN